MDGPLTAGSFPSKVPLSQTLRSVAQSSTGEDILIVALFLALVVVVVTQVARDIRRVQDGVLNSS